MKRRGVAYQRAERTTPISKCLATPVIGVIIGGLAFVLGFAMIWYIWWLVNRLRRSASSIAVAARTFDDDTEFVMPAAEVQAIEDQRRRLLLATVHQRMSRSTPACRDRCTLGARRCT